MLLKLNLQRFAPQLGNVTINFDTHIKKVVATSTNWDRSYTWTTSGETLPGDMSLGASYGQLVTFDVTLDDGYVIDTVTLGDTSSGATIKSKTDTQFIIENGSGVLGSPITITSKKATSQVSIDLTSLSGWNNVSDGEHNIQVVAKADNYRDSEKSTAVSFNKGIATVTIPAGTYRFNEEIAFEANVSYDENIVGKCNTLTDNDTYGGQLEFNNIYAYSDDVNYELSIIIDDVKEIRYSTTGDYRWFYYIVGEDTSSSFEYHVTDTTKLRTITIETDQQVSQEFKTWFDNNTTVVGSFTQVSVTRTSTNRSQISVSKDKIYSVQTKNMPAGSFQEGIYYFKYENGWNCTPEEAVGIVSSTDTSIIFTGYSASPTGDTHLDGWGDVIALEGNKEAIESDFNGFTLENNMASWMCIIEDTLITLANGETKKVQDITYDDELLVWNFYDGKFDKAKPCWVTKPQVAHEYNLCKFSNGVEIGFVGQGGDIGYHRIYNDELKSFTHTGVKETPIGTHTFAQDGSKPTLIEQHIVNKQVRYYNVGTEKHINIFTNGILTSARISNKYAIKDMKYVGERLISEQEEQEYIRKKLKRC